MLLLYRLTLKQTAVALNAQFVKGRYLQCISAGLLQLSSLDQRMLNTIVGELVLYSLSSADHVRVGKCCSGEARLSDSRAVLRVAQSTPEIPMAQRELQLRSNTMQL